MTDLQIENADLRGQLAKIETTLAENAELRAVLAEFEATSAENAELRVQLAEFEANLAALRHGEADALVGAAGIVSMAGADRPYQIFFDAMNEGGLSLDDDGRILHSNSYFSEMVGIRLERLRGQRLIDLVCTFDHLKLMSLLAQRESTKVELNLLNNFGQLVPVLVSLQRFDNVEHHLTCVVVTDLRDLAVAKASIEAKENLFRSIFDSRTEEVAVLDEHGTILGVNAAWQRFAIENGSPDLGLNLVGRNYFQVNKDAGGPPDGSEANIVADGIREVLNGKRSVFSLEYPCHSPSEERWFNLRVTPLLGKKPGCIVSHENITQRNSMEKVLKHYASIIESSEDAVISKTLDGRITYWNKGAEKVFGYKSDEMIGQPIAMMIPEFCLGEEQDIMKQLLNGTVIKHYQTKRLRKGGAMIDVSVTISPIHDEAGNVIGASKVARDISEQKSLEQEIEIAKELAIRANQAKSTFVSNMSHEIRTPLNAVIGFAHLLSDSSLDIEQQQSVTQIQLAGRALLEIVNDVLDLAKIESGEMRVAKIPFSLRTLLTELHGLVLMLAKAKGIKLRFPGLQNNPQDAFIGDITRIRQILLNLLSNAVKFTDKGTVELLVELCEQSRGTKIIRVRFTVKDSGIGISEETQAKLFQPFVQADDSTSRQFGGTGLGLSIVKNLTELLGGEVSLQSELKKGSQFSVELPLLLSDETYQLTSESFNHSSLLEHAGEAVVKHQSCYQQVINGTKMLSPQIKCLPSVRVLLVDDSELNLDIGRKILEREGAVVFTYTSGQESVDWLLNESNSVDVVMMDIQMPGMDGKKATQLIRQSVRLASLPIIALTAGALSEERKAAMEAGMTDFLTKPLEPELMVRTIRRLVEEYRGTVLPVEQRVEAKRLLGGAWPSFLSINVPEVQLRLNDDIELFNSMLRRFLAEFGKFQNPQAILEEPALASYMHKLAGSAVLLGADSLSQAAKDGEKAFKSGARVEQSEAITRIAEEWIKLASEVSSYLTSLPEPIIESDVQKELIDFVKLNDLIDMLNANKFSSVKAFKENKKQLKAHLGQTQFENFEAAMECMDFALASRILCS